MRRIATRKRGGTRCRGPCARLLGTGLLEQRRWIARAAAGGCTRARRTDRGRRAGGSRGGGGAGGRRRERLLDVSRTWPATSRARARAPPLEAKAAAAARSVRDGVIRTLGPRLAAASPRTATPESETEAGLPSRDAARTSSSISTARARTSSGTRWRLVRLVDRAVRSACSRSVLRGSPAPRSRRRTPRVAVHGVEEQS